MFRNSTVLILALSGIALMTPQAQAACGGPRCICSDMTAFDPLPADPEAFDRLAFGYAVHQLDVGLDNFIQELSNWEGASGSAVGRSARELSVEVNTLKDCFCGHPSHGFLTYGVSGLETFYNELQRRYAGDSLINGNSLLRVRMQRIAEAYGKIQMLN